jgi:hypothetical protein
VHPQADLLQVVLARGTGGGLPHFLHGRQQQADEDGDDGDHHQQQLDQRERGPAGAGEDGWHGEYPLKGEVPERRPRWDRPSARRGVRYVM